MFSWLLDIVRSFYNYFATIEYNGASIMYWGFACFMICCVVRFIFPLLHIHGSDWITPVAGRIASGSRTSDNASSEGEMNHWRQYYLAARRRGLE